jgi:hypothetical protein
LQAGASSFDFGWWAHFSVDDEANDCSAGVTLRYLFVISPFTGADFAHHLNAAPADYAGSRAGESTQVGSLWFEPRTTPNRFVVVW